MNLALAHFTIELVGTDEQRGDDVKASCAALWRIVDAAVRRWAPMALEESGHVKDAAALRALPVVTADTSKKTRRKLDRFLSDPGAATQGRLAAEQAAHAISTACEMERGRQSKKLSVNYVISVLGTAAKQAARCANYSGEAAREEARKLVAELSAGFRG